MYILLFSSGFVPLGHTGASPLSAARADAALVPTPASRTATGRA